MKEAAEVPENEAKGRHQKLWEGSFFFFFIIFILKLHFYLEQRAIREAIARDNQMRDMFADLDTNNDSL